MNSRLCSSLEPLEARIAPAGLVTITTAGGSVKIVGDTAANDISIQILAPGVLEVVGNSGTQVKFNGTTGASANFDYAKDLSVALGDGADTVSLAAGGYFGNVTLDGGNGDNTFNFAGATVVPGSLKVLGKAGGDTLTVTSAGADFQVGRDFLIKLGEGGVDSTLAASRLLVGGKLTIAGGGGIEDFSWNLSSDLAVGGDLTITTGKDLDRIGLVATGDVGITGKLTVKGGDNELALGPAIISTSLNVTAGDEMIVRGAASFTSVSGEAVINVGGTNSSEFAQGVSIKTGKGHTVVTMKGATQTYLGKVSVAASGPTDFIMRPTTFFLGGAFSFKGSAARDTFDLEGNGIITGKTSVDLGAGDAQTLTFVTPSAGAIVVFNDIAIKQGAKTGTSATTLIGLQGRKLTVATSDAADTVTLDNLVFRNGASIALGGGADTFGLETLHLTGASILGGLKIALGDGADRSTIGAGNSDDRVTLLDPKTAGPGTGTLDAGPGTDIVSGYAALGNLGTLVVTNVP